VGFVRKHHGGRLRVALAFPNTYFVGMSNLGLQTVYSLLNSHDRIVCERVFLPPRPEVAAMRARRSPLVTIESGTPVRDFDVFAFSVSFEWDYVNVVTMLRLAGLEPRAERRHARDPLVMIGGAVTFVNPEPLAPFADVIAAGEGEHLVPSLVEAIADAGIADREALLVRLRPTRLRAQRLRRATTARQGGRRRLRRLVAQPSSGRPRFEPRAPDPPRRSSPPIPVWFRLLVKWSRLREPLPLLLGRLQLPAGEAVRHLAHPRDRPDRPAACHQGGTGLHRALRPSRHRTHPRGARRDGLRHQPGLASPR
jgi:hypothetical protein